MKSFHPLSIIFSLMFFASVSAFSQGVVVSDTANAIIDASAIFELQSEDKGFLPPKMTTAQRNAIGSPAVGLVVYDTDLESLQVYNGTDWITSTAGSLDDAYDFGGAGAGRTINAFDGPVQINGTSGFVVDHSTASGTIPATGAGVRMMWYPGKYAFRAGRITNINLWNDVNIGSGSVAMGFNTLASGTNSTALGRYADATGDYTFAQGSYAEANGDYSVAIGNNALADGDLSIALGTYVFAPSFGEVAFGIYSTLYSPSSPTAWVGTDRLFSIGNGQNKTSTSNALTILKNGNTGIGVSNPQALLHVDGNFRLENGTEAPGRVLTSDANGNTTWTDPDPLNIILVDSAGGGDYTTITAAINDVTPTANDPVTIMINPGTYEENIELISYITLEGVSSKAVKIMGNGTDVVRMDTITCVALKNLSIGSDGGAATNGVTMYSTDAAFEGVDVLGDFSTGTNTMDFGIKAYNSTLMLEDCRVEEHDDKGVLADSSEVVATNSSFSGSNSGLEVMAGSRLGLFESTVSLGTYGVYILSNGIADLQGNVFDETHIYNVGNLTMIGNRVQNTSSGWALNNEGKAIISGNTFVDCSDQAIIENSGVVGTTISANLIDNCSDGGEKAFTVLNSDATISGNVFRNNTHGDIFVANFSNPWLVGNIADYSSSTTAESVIAGIDDLRFERHEDDLITILPTGGNFGIGTDNPNALLNLKEGTDELQISGDQIYKPDANQLTIKSFNDMLIDAQDGMTLDAATTLDIDVGTNTTLSANAAIDITGGSTVDITGGINVNLNNELYAVNGIGVGVNTSNTLGFNLAVNGTAAKTGGGLWSTYSDSRLKHSIEPMQQGTLDRLLRLQGFTFEYNQDAVDKRLALPGRQTGLIAQQVQEVFPEWVDADPEGYLYITQRGLTALFVESLRELREEKDAEIEELKSKVEELTQRLEELEGVIYSVSARE